LPPYNPQRPTGRTLYFIASGSTQTPSWYLISSVDRTRVISFGKLAPIKDWAASSAVPLFDAGLLHIADRADTLTLTDFVSGVNGASCVPE
jgi:hypothetical protein